MCTSPGSSSATVNFGTGAVKSVGGDDMFVVKYSAAGVPQWTLHFGDNTHQAFYGIAVDASGNVYVTGDFFGTIDFGGGPLTASSYDAVLGEVFTERRAPVVEAPRRNQLREGEGRHGRRQRQCDRCGPVLESDRLRRRRAHAGR